MTSKIKIFIPVAPVSASRPRVSRYGAYYSKSYVNYRNATHKFLKKIVSKYPPKSDSILKIAVIFRCYKPKKPSNEKCPRYDIDNMEKAIYDAITHAKIIWKDDIQIVTSAAIKRYANADELVGTELMVKEISNEEYDILNKTTIEELMG